MKKNSYQILKLNLDDLLEAKKWLVHSYQVCESFKSKEKFSVSDYDALESFLSRFARVCDLLFRKVFRSIDVYELEPCLLYTSPSPRDRTRSRMPSSA